MKTIERLKRKFPKRHEIPASVPIIVVATMVILGGFFLKKFADSQSRISY